MELTRSDRKQRDCTCGLQRSDDDRILKGAGVWNLMRLPKDVTADRRADRAMIRVCRGCWVLYVVRPAE